MKLTIISDSSSAVLRNEKSSIIGQFWADDIKEEKIGNGKRKVTFIQGDELSGYIVVDEVEWR